MYKPDGFAASLTKEVELRSSGFAAANNADAFDVRRVQWEYTLDAFVVHDSPDGEHRIDAPAPARDDRAVENLRTFLVAFLYFARDVNDIADIEARHIFLQAFALNSVQQFCFHSLTPYLCISYFAVGVSHLAEIRATGKPIV